MNEIHLYSTPRQPWRMCPHCGAVHDAATGTARSVKPGAVLVCFDCGEWGLMDPAAFGGWRRPTPDEQHDVLADDQARTVIEAGRRLAAQRNR